MECCRVVASSNEERSKQALQHETNDEQKREMEGDKKLSVSNIISAHVTEEHGSHT